MIINIQMIPRTTQKQTRQIKRKITSYPKPQTKKEMYVTIGNMRNLKIHKTQMKS